jgi:hypothetical protein
VTSSVVMHHHEDQKRLVEIARRLLGNRTVALRLELPAAATRPMVTEDGSSPGSRIVVSKLTYPQRVTTAFANRLTSRCF